MADKNLVMQAIEPHTMSLPAMDRPSVVLAWFMDNIKVEVDTFEFEDSAGPVSTDAYLTCGLCDERIMEIEDGDTLRVMFNTALSHGC